MKHETVEPVPEPVDHDKLHFKERGLSFVPLRESHLRFFELMAGRELDEPFELCAGRTLVDRNCVPLGLCMCVFEPDGETVRLEGYFGKWWQLYPKDCMRSVHEFADHIRSCGVSKCYAVADERIEGAVKLLEWLGGKKTGKSAPIGDYEGPIYELDMFGSKL